MEIEVTAAETQNYVEKLVNVVAKTMVKAFENLTIEDVDMFKLGYSKAVDDFVELYKSKTTMENELVDKIAEQLKGAKQNED